MMGAKEVTLGPRTVPGGDVGVGEPKVSQLHLHNGSGLSLRRAGTGVAIRSGPQRRHANIRDPRMEPNTFINGPERGLE